MSLDLDYIFQENINLYEVLGISIGGSPAEVSPVQIKKQYRKLALLYHPDKQPDNPDIVHKFHLLSLATNVLTDDSLKSTYDQWLTRIIKGHDSNEQRKELTEKLHKLESKARRRDEKENTEDLSRIQEYGAMLRKLKHFKLPYGDWKTVNTSVKSQEAHLDQHRFYDSSTLRIEISNVASEVNLSNKNVLLSAFRDLFGVDMLYDVYYSSRNDFTNDESIVAYAVFEKPEVSQTVYKKWISQSQPRDWGFVLDISPRIPIHYYGNFTKNVELEPRLAALVNNNTIVID